MKNQIGCTCMIFHENELLNESSIDLPQQMHSHSDCICASFLQNEVSNAFSSGLHQYMQSHISRICETSYMYPQMGCTNRSIVILGAFEGFFSRVNSQMSPEVACPNRCKVTLVTFICLLSVITYCNNVRSFRRRGLHYGGKSVSDNIVLRDFDVS